MAGIRIGGVAVIFSCTPPFSALEGSAGDGDGQVYRACADVATALTDFTGGGATYEITHNPVYSPNGQKVLFEASNTSTGFTEIWVATGGVATQVLADASNYYMQPMWHPDGDTFCCIHGSGGAFEGSIEVSSISDPGTIDVIITQDGVDAPYRPAFNFDGTRIAYIWDQITGTGGELRTCAPDGSGDSLLDTITRYQFDGGQLSWANTQDTVAYSNGATPFASVFIINGDGTGKTQVNANGDASGLACRCSSYAWPANDSFVLISALNTAYHPTACELDGSDSTFLDPTNGASSAAGQKQVLAYQGRAWYIASSTSIESNSLSGGDHRVDLTIDGVQITALAAGDGWYAD